MFDNELWHWLHNSDGGALWRFFADAFCLAAGLVVVGLLLLWLGVRLRVRWVAARQPLAAELSGKETIGFFHPYCAAGGGGERVLWCAIHAIQREHPEVHCVVYTGDDTNARDILAQADRRFGVRIQPETVHFAYLSRRRWVEASSWPRFTLLGQSLGSVVLAFEALCLFIPDSFVDSMGYAFTYPLVWCVGRSRIGCYVHYPTISTDMLESVRSRRVGVCNTASVASSPLKSLAKWVYYRAFALVYGIVGSFAEVVLANSSWTRGHLEKLWGESAGGRGGIALVYPPCDTSALNKLKLARMAVPEGGRLVVSLAQFRPEKDHPMQLRALARLFSDAPSLRSGAADERVRLVVAGGVRDAGDQSRLEALYALCDELGLRRRVPPQDGAAEADWDVDFRANVSLQDVHTLLGQATVGLHTMRDEHFGISVVEFMAAGAIVLAHDSAGPAMDIVRPRKDGSQTGFLATDEASYAAALRRILSLSAKERGDIAANAREAAAERFSQEAFETAFLAYLVAPFLR